MFEYYDYGYGVSEDVYDSYGKIFFLLILWN